MAGYLLYLPADPVLVISKLHLVKKLGLEQSPFWLRVGFVKPCHLSDGPVGLDFCFLSSSADVLIRLRLGIAPFLTTGLDLGFDFCHDHFFGFSFRAISLAASATLEEAIYFPVV